MEKEDTIREWSNKKIRGEKAEEEAPEEWVSENRRYSCWLFCVPGLGNKKIFRLRETFLSLFAGDPLQFAKGIYSLPEDELAQLWREAGLDTLSSGGGDVRKNKCFCSLLAARHKRPDEDLLRAQRSGLSFTSVDDPDFPDRLRGIPDAPYGIYYRGALPDDAAPAVAIVGSRMATGYGRECARKFGYELARYGVQIISGLARGVDGIAQRGAIDAGGKSFGVLGCGADMIYPRENEDLYRKVVDCGGVISEYAPGTAAQARLFPARNRIISALSDLVLVVEAKERSGSLITADYALAQGRDVYAVPGRITDLCAVGCNRLIRQGAGIATCPEDVLEAAAGVRKTEEDEAKPSGYFKRMSLQEPEASLYDVLDSVDAKDLTTLMEAAGERLHRQIQPSEAMMYMTDLCLKGLAEEAAAGMYRKKPD